MWLRNILNYFKMPTDKELAANKLAARYLIMYNAAVVNVQKTAELKRYANKIEENRGKYEAVANGFTGMPYWFVAVIHVLESNANFTTHLHNGDKLTARTVQVPKGRPKSGTPPFTWRESADDALRYKSYEKVKDWSVSNCLVLLERYNGLGYQKKNLPSPYLWSYTQYYFKGKYVSDGKFDPEAVSKQPGVVAIMKTIGV
jgi:lysozyme family protein